MDETTRLISDFQYPESLPLADETNIISVVDHQDHLRWCIHEGRSTQFMPHIQWM